MMNFEKRYPMKNINGSNMVFGQLMASVRIAATTMLVCCGIYTLVILGIGRIVTPQTADGSLVKDDHGQIIGSALIAQKFSRPQYFWPRPSAVDYNAAASGGSNLSPAGSAVAQRTVKLIDTLGGDHQIPVPADLVTASGSGLDPHITIESAKFQAARVAKARGLKVETLMSLLIKHAKKPGRVFTPDPLVNVLRINMELDRISRDNS
jgi:potassium-transporting ATPase KdpC subunit